ncbi:MAG: hypothetical protein KJ601_05115, partial [Nanoarchaeota archaeon]|nr:hypothetical protein [Nanoarchaeota archaeon]
EQPTASIEASPTGFGGGMKPFGAPPPRMQSHQSPPSPPPPIDQTNEFADYKLQRDVEIVSYKLDSLKSAIDSINQRLANIERLAFESVNR